MGIQMDHNDQERHKVDFLIIGGGVAGLSAANRMADLGGKPVIVESGNYPSHKICGEFFSNECHEILRDWDLLPPVEVSTVRYHVGECSYEFPLPFKARGGSRHRFDESLYKRAESGGCKFLLDTKVERIDYDSSRNFPYSVFLHTGMILLARTLFLGTGRLLNLLQKTAPPKLSYYGFKTHIEGGEIKDRLEMAIFPSGYLGISPIENNKVNVACIAEAAAVKKFSTPVGYLENVLDGIPLIKGILDKKDNLFRSWLVAEVPEFALRPHSIRRYRNLYLVGDAAASIAPASGDGLAMAVTSGVKAAEFALRGEDRPFREYWKRNYTKRLRWAKGVHKIMFHPFLSKTVLAACSRFPWVFKVLYKRTRN